MTELKRLGFHFFTFPLTALLAESISFRRRLNKAGSHQERSKSGATSWQQSAHLRAWKMSQAIELEDEHQEEDQEVQLQDQPNGKRRKKSPVWKDFEELESDDPSMTKAKCRICKKILTAQSKNGTSHLKRHIEIHDKGQASLDQYVLRAESNPDGSVALKNHKFDPDLIRRAIAVFLTGGEHPFTVVEEVGFRYLLNCCVPQFKKIGRFTVKRDIMAMDATFLANFDLSETEWKKVAVMTNFLKSFHEVTCTFSGTKYPTANLYFNGVFKIHSQLLQVAKEPQTFMSPMVTKMKIKFDKYWKIHVDESTAEEQVNKVVAKVYELFDEYKVLNPTASNTNPSNNVEQNRQDDLFDDYAEYLTTLAPQTQKSQLDLYLEEPTRDPKVDLDVLEFWKASSVSYPDLANMARDLLTIPVSSVASESAFSIGKKVITPSRSSLNPETVEALVCLQDWMLLKEGHSYRCH